MVLVRSREAVHAGVDGVVGERNRAGCQEEDSHCRHSPPPPTHPADAFAHSGRLPAQPGSSAASRHLPLVFVQLVIRGFRPAKTVSSLPGTAFVGIPYLPPSSTPPKISRQRTRSSKRRPARADATSTDKVIWAVHGHRRASTRRTERDRRPGRGCWASGIGDRPSGCLTGTVQRQWALASVCP